MNTKHILIAALLAGAFAPAFSYASADSLEPAFDIKDAEPAMAAMPHPALGGALMLPHRGVVKNAPYSAEVISEQLQTLADGNQIVKKQTSVSYRDSAGRTRQETRDDSGAIKSVAIHDPVAGYSVMLNPATKMANKRATLVIPPRAKGGDRRQDRLAMRLERAEAGLDGAAERRQVIIKRIERAEGQATARIHENVRIQVLNNMEGRPMPGLERLQNLGPMLAGTFGDMKWSSKATVRELGTKEIEGLKATGKLRSYEIPAGDIGNRNPILVSNESWYSPELQVTLMTKRSDPRTGDKIYRLAGIKRDEPAAALFAIPSDYTVKEPTIRIQKMEKKLEEKK